MSGHAAEIESLEALLRPVAAGLGCELWGVERLGGRGRPLLRVYIDAERGVTVADCEAVSRQASAVLEVQSEAPGKAGAAAAALTRGGWTLEVSSPGLERPLFTPSQFRRYLGELVRLRLDGTAIQNEKPRRNLSGRLQSATDDTLRVRADNDAVYEIPLSAVRRANLIRREAAGSAEPGSA